MSSHPELLTQAQHLAWLHQHPAPATTREALGRLQTTVAACLAAFDEDQLVTAQTRLEDSLLDVLIAMRTLGLQPEAALQRALQRLQEAPGQRAFHFMSDRVEIRVRQEVRGGWPIGSQAEYEAALTLAREWGCDVFHDEAHQLGLFSHAR